MIWKCLYFITIYIIKLINKIQFTVFKLQQYTYRFCTFHKRILLHASDQIPNLEQKKQKIIQK